MTLKAHEVLCDCKRLLDDLNKEPQSDLWRLRWAGLVALLRAVGHVLKEVDAEVSPEAEGVINSAWEELKSRKPEPEILWEFIEGERNNILKTYAFGPRINITVRPGPFWVNLVTGESGNLPSGPTTFEHFMLLGKISC